jgi:hypothetical protein
MPTKSPPCSAAASANSASLAREAVSATTTPRARAAALARLASLEPSAVPQALPAALFAPAAVTNLSRCGSAARRDASLLVRRAGEESEPSLAKRLVSKSVLNAAKTADPRTAALYATLAAARLPNAAALDLALAALAALYAPDDDTRALSKSGATSATELAADSEQASSHGHGRNHERCCIRCHLFCAGPC